MGHGVAGAAFVRVWRGPKPFRDELGGLLWPAAPIANNKPQQRSCHARRRTLREEPCVDPSAGRLFWLPLGPARIRGIASSCSAFVPCLKSLQKFMKNENRTKISAAKKLRKISCCPNYAAPKSYEKCRLALVFDSNSLLN